MPTCPHPPCPCGHKNMVAQALINHVQSSPWSALYFCAKCTCVCKSEAALISHKKKVHKVKNPPVAPSPQARPSPSVARAHYCQICNRQYTSAEGLQQHYRDTPVHPNCARCDMIGFVDSAALQAHNNSAHPLIPLGAFPCRTCNLSYPSAAALRQHYLASTVHPTCTRCNTGFVDNFAMQTHAAAIHPPISSPAFTCQTCELSFSGPVTLDHHYLDAPVHPKCTRCDIGFVDNATMQAHVVSVHRPITCGTCSGLKIYQEDVADHYRISPRHPSCTICDVGFENQEAFDAHNNTSHPAFRCETCDLPFSSAALLDVHYQESPRHPRCPECRLSFEDNVALIKHVIAIFNPLIKDSGRLILKTSQMNLHDQFSDASFISRASGSISIVRSPLESPSGAISPARSVSPPISDQQRHVATPSPPHSIADIFDPDAGVIDEDSGGLVLVTSQTSLHDAFSNALASIVSRGNRSPSVARSLSEVPIGVGALSPTRSIASSVSIQRRRLFSPSPTRGPVVASNSDRENPEGSLGSPRVSLSGTRSPSPISRAGSISDQVIILDSFAEREEFQQDPEPSLSDIAPSQHSRALSPVGSITTRFAVAASETMSPVSSARSIFGTITSTSPAQAAVLSAFGVGPTSVGRGNVSSTKEDRVETMRSRASSIRSTPINPRTGVRRNSISPSSTKTTSPSPSHVVVPSSDQPERFRIAPASNRSRADSISNSRVSERFHSSEPGSLLRRSSPIENTTKATPTLAEKHSTSPCPSSTVGATTQPQHDALAPGERFVSYVYCRICRRDPCRQPAATMCGHVFCYPCISSEVMEKSHCPVCEAPTLLYSIFKLHLV
ncbi:hypothetical protein BC827DRAFT_106401 [Russula dissimulans]|nr:hypothetical protein BC827DRAFT_106401 [Russula dissimulans]